MKVTSYRRRGYVFTAAWVALALLLPREAARADVKIVAQVEVTGRPPQAPGSTKPGPPMGRPPQDQDSTPPASPMGRPPQDQDATRPESPRTVTTYYQGDKARVEAADGLITLYDAKASKVYTLDPDQKTYWVVSLKQMLQRSGMGDRTGPQGGRMQMKMETKVTVKAAVEKKTLAEKEARKYVVTGTVKMVPDFGGQPPGGGFPGGPGGGGPGGGFPGPGGGGTGGGFPGGGGPGGGPPPDRRGPGGGRPEGMGRALPTLEIEGEYWLSEAGAVRATSSKNKMALLPSFAQTLTEAPMTEALLSSLVKKMAKTKGFPLASRVTLKIQSPQRPSAPQPDEPESDAPEPVVITTTVQSITEEPLDERLFQVPEDYQKVEPPSLRPRPGPPRPGEADGPPKDPSSW